MCSPRMHHTLDFFPLMCFTTVQMKNGLSTQARKMGMAERKIDRVSEELKSAKQELKNLMELVAGSFACSFVQSFIHSFVCSFVFLTPMVVNLFGHTLVFMRVRSLAGHLELFD